MTAARNILFLHHVSSLGGAETVLLSIARGLDPRNYHPILLAQEEGPLTDAFRKIPGEIITLALPAWRKGKNFLRRYLTVRRLVRIVKEKKVNLIHCHQYRLAPYLAGIGKACKIPLVLHVHDPLNKGLVKRFQVDRIPHIITVSDFVRGTLGELSQKAETIHNGIDVESYSQAQAAALRQEFRLPKEAPLIGMVANFTENKRPQLFIEIAERINAMQPAYRFILVGHDAWNTGVTQERLQQIVNEKNLRDRIFFTGWRADLPQILKALDAIVICSVVESFPLSVLEAMAAGAIVFAQKDAGGPREQITDGHNGFLVDCVNVEECAQKIVAVLSDEMLRKRIVPATFQTVQKRFSREEFLRKITAYYSRLFDNGGGLSLASRACGEGRQGL